MFPRQFLTFIAALGLFLLLAGVVASQEKNPPANPFAPPAVDAGQSKAAEGPLPKLNLPGQFDFGPDLGGGGDVQLSAGFKVAKETGEGKLYVAAEVSPGWHIYSITQKAGGPLPSSLKVGVSKSYEVGPFEPDIQPRIHKVPEFPVPAEEHEGTVTWTAPLKLASGTKPEELSILITYTGQVCQDAGACIPLNKKLVAKFEGYLEPPGTPGEYRPARSHVTWRGHIEPSVVAPGSKAKLVLTATPDDEWHIYPYGPNGEKGNQVSAPTLVVLSNAAGWKQSAVSPSQQPKPLPEQIPGEATQYYYDGEVTFTIDLTVPPAAKPGEARLTGFLGFQTCKQSCDKPDGAKFTVAVPVGATEQAGKIPLLFEPDNYKHVSEIAAQQPIRSDTVDPVSLAVQLVLSLIGGFLLNLMPCVLPVLGLKIMAFVKQGGQSHGQILTLNLAYAAGLMLVFLFLATLSAFFNQIWGEQMTQLWFRVLLLVMMFAFGLSFLGVWEMTIPGLAGSEVVHAAEGREGPVGAIFKGILTTILGISCSGPFLGGVFGYTLTQPWWVTYLIFICIGVGMASPFLLIGAFPRLISLLPKPGEWMNTFKHVMGFVMLGVAIYFFSTLGEKYYIPALTLLVGVGFGLWWIGRVPIYEETGKQLRAWLIGSAAAAAIGWFGFAFLGPVKELYEWKPYFPETLAKYQAEQKTVMLDFTADWCLNCQLNFRTAINTQAVKEVVEKNGVVPMKADWTDQNEAIKNKLAELNSQSIPILAIYPADRPEDVIILRDLVTKKQVLEALEKAGPSAAEDSESRVAKVGSGG